MAQPHRMTLWERKERDRLIRRVAAVILVPIDLLFAGPYLYLILGSVWILVAVPAWFFSADNAALIGLAADGVLILAASALIAVRARNLASTILGRLDALPVPTGEQEQARSALETMAIAAGMGTPPGLWIIESSAVNAMAVGLSVSDTRIALTRGMLERLPASELAAIFAHLIARIVSGDVFADTLGTAVVATVLPVDGQPSGGLPGRRRRSALALERADTDAQFLLRDPDALLGALNSLAIDDNNVAGTNDIIGALFVSWPGFAGDLAFIGDDDSRRVERIIRLRHEPMPDQRGHA